jgi:hypothetical protein
LPLLPLIASAELLTGLSSGPIDSPGPRRKTNSG